MLRATGQVSELDLSAERERVKPCVNLPNLGIRLYNFLVEWNMKSTRSDARGNDTRRRARGSLLATVFMYIDVYLIHQTRYRQGPDFTNRWRTCTIVQKARMGRTLRYND